MSSSISRALEELSAIYHTDVVNVHTQNNHNKDNSSATTTIMTTSERAQQLAQDDNLQRLLLEEVQKSGFVTAAGYKAVLQKILHTNALQPEEEMSNIVNGSSSPTTRDVVMMGNEPRRVSEITSSLSTHNNIVDGIGGGGGSRNNSNRRRPARSMICDSMFGSMIKSNLSTTSTVSSSLTASNTFSSSLLSSSVTASNLSSSLSFSKRSSLGGSIIGGTSNNKHVHVIRASNFMNNSTTFEDFIEEQAVFPEEDEYILGGKSSINASGLLSNNLAPRRRSDYSVRSISSEREDTPHTRQESFTRRKGSSSREGRQGSCRRSRLIKLSSVKFDDPQEEEDITPRYEQDDTPAATSSNVDEDKVKKSRTKKNSTTKKKQHKKKVVPTEVTTMNNSDPSFFMNSDTNLDSKEFDPQAFINNLVCSPSRTVLTPEDINLKLKKSGSEKWLPWPSASKRNLLRRQSSRRSSVQSSFSSYDVDEEEEEDDEEGKDSNKSSSHANNDEDDGADESGNSEEWLAWPDHDGSSRSLLVAPSSIRARAA